MGNAHSEESGNASPTETQDPKSTSSYPENSADNSTTYAQVAPIHRTTTTEIKHVPTPSNAIVHEHEVVCCCMDATLCYFRMFHMMCGLVVVLNFVENCIVLTKDFNGRTDIRDVVMRFYDVIFCILCIFVEMDLRYIVDNVKLMDNWIFRGKNTIFALTFKCNRLRFFRRENLMNNMCTNTLQYTQDCSIYL